MEEWTTQHWQHCCRSSPNSRNRRIATLTSWKRRIRISIDKWAVSDRNTTNNRTQCSDSSPSWYTTFNQRRKRSLFWSKNQKSNFQLKKYQGISRHFNIFEIPKYKFFCWKLFKKWKFQGSAPRITIGNKRPFTEHGSANPLMLTDGKRISSEDYTPNNQNFLAVSDLNKSSSENIKVLKEQKRLNFKV